MAQVTTSVTISFATGAGSETGQNSFSAEVDSRKEGFNKGNTSFYPNDTVYILLYKGSNVGAVTVQASAGSVSAYTSDTITKKETFSLANSREIRPSVPVAGAMTVTWYGTPHNLTQMGEALFVTDQPVVATGEIEYQAAADVFTLSGVSYPQAVVFFTGETLT